MRLLCLLLLLLFSASNVFAGEETVQESFSFVVLGHVRGSENGKLNDLFDELLAEVGKLNPDIIFLTGDMIWGDYHKPSADDKAIEHDWDLLDKALGQLGVPVYRVPGNHDINDPVTRGIFFKRYGEMPQAISFSGSRFILLSSPYVPEGEGPHGRKYAGGVQLDSKQVDFIKRELSVSDRYNNVFLFMHHMLWWSEDAKWWSDVHSLLAGKNVRAVFGGDFGPMKFSHMWRDGIDYVQSSIEGIPSVEILRGMESSRLLSQQFDNFLYVTVNGTDVNIDVKTIGEMTFGKFSPQQWRAVHENKKPLWLNDTPDRQPGRSTLFDRIWKVVGSPKRLIAIGLLIMFSFMGGVMSTLVWRYIRSC